MWATALLGLLSVSCCAMIFSLIPAFSEFFFPEFSLLGIDVSTCDMAEQQAVMSARCLWQVKCEVRTPSNHRVIHSYPQHWAKQARQYQNTNSSTKRY